MYVDLKRKKIRLAKFVHEYKNSVLLPRWHTKGVNELVLLFLAFMMQFSTKNVDCGQVRKMSFGLFQPQPCQLPPMNAEEAYTNTKRDQFFYKRKMEGSTKNTP